MTYLGIANITILVCQFTLFLDLRWPSFDGVNLLHTRLSVQTTRTIIGDIQVRHISLELNTHGPVIRMLVTCIDGSFYSNCMAMTRLQHIIIQGTGIQLFTCEHKGCALLPRHDTMVAFNIIVTDSHGYSCEDFSTLILLFVEKVRVVILCQTRSFISCIIGVCALDGDL
jgi:hypothetical protein